MHPGTVICQIALDGDLKSVTPIGNDGQAWVLPIDQSTHTALSVWRHSRICDFQVIRDGTASHEPGRIIICGDTKAIAPARPCEWATGAS